MLRVIPHCIPRNLNAIAEVLAKRENLGDRASRWVARMLLPSLDERISVYDAIALSTGHKNPKQVWNELSERFPEVVQKTDYFTELYQSESSVAEGAICFVAQRNAYAKVLQKMENLGRSHSCKLVRIFRTLGISPLTELYQTKSSIQKTVRRLLHTAQARLMATINETLTLQVSGLANNTASLISVSALCGTLCSEGCTVFTMTEQPNTKISSLCDRYGLTAKRAIYDRINGLNIEPVKKGEVSPEQLERLDRLHIFLTENPRAAIADFLKQPAVNEVTVMVDNSSDLALANDYRVLSGILASVVSLVKTTIPPQSALANYRELEDAAQKGWILPTSKVTALAETVPRGKEFVRGSFTFVKTGKIGQQAGWKVVKNL